MRHLRLLKALKIAPLVLLFLRRIFLFFMIIIRKFIIRKIIIRKIILRKIIIRKIIIRDYLEDDASTNSVFQTNQPKSAGKECVEKVKLNVQVPNNKRLISRK